MREPSRSDHWAKIRNHAAEIFASAVSQHTGYITIQYQSPQYWETIAKAAFSAAESFNKVAMEEQHE